MREKILTSDLSISGYFEQVWFLWQKRPPPSMRENFLTLDLSISGNFEQVCFCGRKVPPLFCLLVRHSAHVAAHDITSQTDISCIIEYHIGDELAEKPPPPMREIFCLQIYPFQAILSNFGFCGRKAPPPRWGKFFWLWIYPFQVILSKFGFLWQKSTLPSRMRENFLTLDLSISGDFEQVWFLWQKSPPPLFSAFWWDTQLVLQHMM